MSYAGDVVGPIEPSQLSSAASLAQGFDNLYVQRPRLWLVVILAAYTLAAMFLATYTPRWQAPDEPAHYNYVAHVAETASLPLLKPGDYDGAYLDLLKSTRFAPSLSIASLRYENYQPPLYYIVASPVYALSAGNPLALRYFNVFLGLISLMLLYLCLELVFPGKTLISLGATAFAALLPMHVAIAASVTNDVLAELLMIAASLVLLRWMRTWYYADSAPVIGPQDRRSLIFLGFLLGMGLLTKVYAYAVLPMFAAVVVWTVWRSDRTWQGLWRGIRCALLMIAPALLLALPMWLRNVATYGNGDFLGLARHDEVVIGQARTTDWILQYGSLAYFERAFSLTFRSFWGVFGWMGVFMDERVYTAALVFTGVLFLGLLWASIRLISGEPDTDMDAFQTTVIAIFGLLLVAVVFSYVWYNLKFVQHQGRYLFWGMLGIGTVVALGWREVLHPLQGTITGLMIGTLTISMILARFMGLMGDQWNLVTVAVVTAFLLLQPLLLIGTHVRHPWHVTEALVPWMRRPAVSTVVHGLRVAAWSLPFVLLFVLDLSLPFLFILPQLAG